MLTIFMTTYNRQDFIKKSVESVLNQSFKDFRLIVLNNCSTDGTLQILDSIKDSRLEIITHKENIGAINNGNWAFDHVTTDYFMIVHDDDILEPSLVETEIRFMEENLDVVMVATTANIINEKDEFVTSRAISNLENCNKYYYEGAKYFENKISHEGKEVVCPTAMFRKKWFEEHNLRSRAEAGPACDYVLYSEMCFAGGKICVLDLPLIRYREHSGQDSFNNLCNKFDLRDLDTLYKLKDEYKIQINNEIFSKMLSHRLAFRAYRLALAYRGNEVKETVNSAKQKEYFMKLEMIDSIVIFVAVCCPFAIRLASSIRNKRKRK